MIVVVLLTAMAGVFIANSSPFNGRFLPGLLIVVAPVLLLSFALPKLLPVRCEKCLGRMQFRWLGPKPQASGENRSQPDLYAYICAHCGDRHVWEASDSGHGLG
jgi:hypothetical protein